MHTPFRRAMLGFSIYSMGIVLRIVGSEVEAKAVSASADVFSSLGILVMVKCLSFLASSLTTWRYASNSPLNWLMTSYESHNASSSFAPSSIARRMPAIMASYSASLLEALKPSLNNCPRTSFVGDFSVMPMPDPCWLDDPSA
ncbi:unnamed protein product [Cochlearia groenlandica]